MELRFSHKQGQRLLNAGILFEENGTPLNCVIKKCNICASHSLLLLVNVKVKFVLEQATKAQRGSRGIAVLFL